MKYLHIYTPVGDGAVVTEYERIEVEKCPSLKELQEMVDGLIELVQVKYNDKMCDMIIDEEGLLKGKAHNRPASRFMQDAYDGYGHIVGKALVFEGFKLP